MMKTRAKKIWDCAKELITAINENELTLLANDLTYRMLLSSIPFLLFLMSCSAFVGLDARDVAERLQGAMPEQAVNFAELVVDQVADIKSAGILSVSLLVTLYNASNGFAAAVDGINKAYGIKDRRGFIKRRLLSVLLAMVFAVAAILAVTFLVAGVFELGWAGSAGSLAVLLAAITLIYRFALARPTPYRKLLPGSGVTLAAWVGVSKLFNIYVSHFSSYANVYGSLAGVIIFITWLNILSFSLLVGGTVNALFDGDPDTPCILQSKNRPVKCNN